MRRGDLYSARLDPVEGSEQAGMRPVVLLSTTEFNEVMPVVTAAPLTSHLKGARYYSNEVVVRKGSTGLRADSVVLAHQVRTISKSRLGRRIGSVDTTTLRTVDEALRLHLDL